MRLLNVSLFSYMESAHDILLLYRLLRQASFSTSLALLLPWPSGLSMAKLQTTTLGQSRWFWLPRGVASSILWLVASQWVSIYVCWCWLLVFIDLLPSWMYLLTYMFLSFCFFQWSTVVQDQSWPSRRFSIKFPSQWTFRFSVWTLGLGCESLKICCFLVISHCSNTHNILLS